MDVSHPYRVISHRLDGAALSVLAGTETQLSARQVAELAPEGSQPGILKALDRLEANGLVDVVRTGNASLYSLNRDHVAAPAIESLMNLRTTLVERIRLAIESWPIKPVHVSLFGSAARRDGGTESDIDILAVLPDTTSAQGSDPAELVEDLARMIRTWSGNHANISRLSEREFIQLLGSGTPLMKNLQQDSIPILGPPLENLQTAS